MYTPCSPTALNQPATTSSICCVRADEAQFGQRSERALTSLVNYSRTAVRVRTTCESCHRALELECEGIAGMAGYETYNEYVCPRCRKLSRARTPGQVISARPTD